MLAQPLDRSTPKASRTNGTFLIDMMISVAAYGSVTNKVLVSNDNSLAAPVFLTITCRSLAVVCRPVDAFVRNSN